MENCVTVDMPAAKADFCAPVVNFGQAGRLFLANAGNPMVNPADLAEWTARIDNADVTDPTKIREFNIIGSKPKPESSAVDFSRGRKVYTPKDHQFPFKIDEMHADNYAFMQFLEENAGQQYIAYYTVNKFLYQIDLATMQMDEITPESEDELQYFDCLLEWDGNHPPRFDNPFA